MSEGATEDRLITVSRHFVEGRGGDPNDVHLDGAICQDFLIFGIDVDDYVAELEEEFGPVVWSIPWLHFTDQTGSVRGCRACVVMPFVIPWMLFKKLIWGPESLTVPDPRNHPYRLTLRQVADAIDSGGWPNDWEPE